MTGPSPDRLQPVHDETDDPLAGIELVVFDKDGTLVDFDAMWVPWAYRVAEGLEAATALTLAHDFFEMIGFDAATNRAVPGGGLSGAPMSVLRDETISLLRRRGLDDAAIDRALTVAWHPPDPVADAVPLADLPGLFETLAERGLRFAVATGDDRVPTEATLRGLGIARFVEGIVCADDERGIKPEPDLLLWLAGELGVEPPQMAIVGDTEGDLRMARAARAGRAIGVLSGVSSRADLEPWADAILPSIADLARNTRKRSESVAERA